MLRTLILVMVSFWLANGTAQQPTAPVSVREVPEESWERAAGNLDYSNDRPPEPPVKKEPQSTGRDWTLQSEFWGKMLQVLAILVGVAVIGYGIYRMLQSPRNRQIAADGVPITMNNLEDYIHESDLDAFLRDALAQRQYAQAIRLYYLMAIKALSQNGDILWAKQKTNRDYLKEMQGRRLETDFMRLTREYERIWYGNSTLDATNFQLLEPEFKSFLQLIPSQ